MASPPQRRRAARHQQPLADTTATRRGPSAGRKKPITVAAIIETALGIVEREGYDALTMRRVAGALETGPASLYAHVVNKEDLDDLLIGRLCSEIELPKPDPDTWREQIVSVCSQIRDQYLRYPGISLAALAVVPTNLETLRVNEGVFGIVLAGGVEAQTAAWAIDTLFLYVNAFCLETSLIDRHVDQEGWAVSRDELLSRFAGLPDSFPQTKRYAAELTSGTALDRFAFTLNLIMDGLGDRKERSAQRA
ncbi:MAG TPA: TetR/AcrR family transcriptional regulator [Candidatus Dormibacteraeota bacterium]|jgi:AcrR family transcriptional regulator|nr:TetR/AcrR family transcriptional regulator [Candidatus Dormibacteraeota bacterium]